MTNINPEQSDTSTRWWWVRHAPVTINNGRMYGATDPKADIVTPEIYRGLAELLPSGAVCLTSALQRTQQTLDEIMSHGLNAKDRKIEENLSYYT